MTIDQMILEADHAAARIRARASLPPLPVVVLPPRDLTRPRRRRHRRTPIEYRMSRAELIIAGTALALLIGALTFPLAWILFRIAA